ncbi:hypothetical protein IW136_000094 [Coemansia sp. RSA 678]|nr:hypothetical protein IW136_000094 [Coemansia sp. RSA 678]
MISQAELESVVRDIIGVAAAADLDPTHISDDEDEQSENSFLPRSYDIDRLHADDARDKVFVAILKALAARRNKPSSPRELATCIMKHEFTLLGGATPYATVSSRISQHFKRIFEHTPPRPPILGRVAHEKHTRKYFYYVSSAHEQEDFLRKVRAGIIPTQPVVSATPSSRRTKTKKPRCMVPAIAVETDMVHTCRSRRATSAGVSSAHTSTGRANRRVSHGQVERDELVRRTSYGDSGESASDSDANPYARKRFKSVRSAVACVYPRRSSRVVDETRAPHARRSASHGDPSALQGNDPDHAARIDSVGSSSSLRESAGPRPQRTDRGTGKWRSAYTSSEDEGSRSVWSDNTDAGPSRPESPSSAYASASEQTVEPANAMLLPPVPHTTPRASVSPDQTPFPPATSPSFHCYTDEMQAASPLLLPRSLMAIDGGLFDPGSPSLAQKDISSASLTPLVTPAIVVHSDDSVVPAHPFLLTQKPDGHSDTTQTQQTTPPSTANSDSAVTEPQGDATQGDSDTKGIVHTAAAPAELTPPDEPTELDFSFHDLMDAELMSVNELDTLWTTSHPATHTGGFSALETIPESREDAKDCTAHSDDELPSRLTQKLLALSSGPATNSSAKVDPEPTKVQMEIHSAPEPVGRRNPVCEDKTMDSVEPTQVLESSEPTQVLDSVEPTRVLASNTDSHDGGTSGGSKIILPDPFADIPATAMVATKVTVSPRIVLTIVETVPVYMTVITTTEPAASCRGKWIVRRHRLLRLVENGYVNASSLLLAGGVASEQERSIVLSLEVGRFKWRRPQSKLYGTWIPLPRARALAATCSLNHRLGPFLNDNLESYFPAPLPTTFIRHLIMPFFSDQSVILADGTSSAEATAREAGLGIEFQHLVNSTVAARSQSISRSSTFGATARGTPSPSIIQSLAARGAPFGLVGSAKTIFGADDRQLNSLLQLLSAEGPMLGSVDSRASEQTMRKEEVEQSEEPGHSTNGLSETGQTKAPLTPLSATSAELRRVTDVLAQSTISGTSQDTKPQSNSVSPPTISSLQRVTRSRSRTVSQQPTAVETEAQGVDAHQLSAAIASSLDKAPAHPVSHDKSSERSAELCDDDDRAMECTLDDLDMSMVMPGSDNDADLISRSTPPSPPSAPLRFRRISTAPLRISRSSSISSVVDTEGDTERSTSTRTNTDGADNNEGTTRQYHSASGTFNARLAQTMEAFGFTGTAKTNLLLRLRAAAAAKSTGRQQAVAPYLLYRNGPGGSAGSAVKRGQRAGSDDVDDVGRKRARVVRIPRSKPPLPPTQAHKGRARARAAAPDPSVVLRLASAIYNHTLNMAAQNQRATEVPAKPTVASVASGSVRVSQSAPQTPSRPQNPQQQLPCPPSHMPGAAMTPKPGVRPPMRSPMAGHVSPGQPRPSPTSAGPNCRPPMRPPMRPLVANGRPSPGARPLLRRPPNISPQQMQRPNGVRPPVRPTQPMVRRPVLAQQPRPIVRPGVSPRPVVRPGSLASPDLRTRPQGTSQGSEQDSPAIRQMVRNKPAA